MAEDPASPHAEESPRRPIGVYDVVAVMLDQLASVAWQKLGLHPDPITGTVDRNLVEAKVAIDICADLAGHLDSQLDEDDRRQVHNLVRNLRLNYVEKSKESA